MLSIILYGRNDSHGYNLHKRGALSLNCIAEVLTSPDDEILFVDYNTPDELPTFPEAIADTLTDQCKARLRILRVRPSFHAQFSGMTRLVALECQSRNIAARRSNPANRWILSTNTDMIFCPSPPYGSLSEVVGSLDDGFYHLPRFELPEGFWERLDRKDPQAAIAAMREQGVRFHLNEIVYGFYDNLYEGPGDFQLFLRQDYFDVHGFDERMILGWHADANMARRMRLLRGEVKTAFDRVYGYHCGHTRLATSLHGGGGRTENDQIAFVADIDSPYAPWQAESWGAPDVEFEEIRLSSRDVYLPAMDAALPAPGPQFSEARLSVGSVGKVSYEAEHVVPHLCDLVYNLPAGQKIFFFGDDAVLFKGLKGFLETAGKAPQFLLPVDGPLSPAVLEELAGAGGVMPFAEALEKATLLLVQHPSYSDDPSRDEAWRCHRVLANIVWVERQRPLPARRRVVVVNGLHNGMAARVEAALAPASMPFSSRLRQGFVVDGPTGGRQMALDSQEVDLVTRALDGLIRGEPIIGWERLASELLEILDQPREWARVGIDAEGAAVLRPVVETALQNALMRIAHAPKPRTGLKGLTRLCSGEDWLEPDWIALAQDLFGQRPSRLGGRTRWTWERLGIVHALNRLMPADDPACFGGAAPRILVVTAEPDFAAPLACSVGYQVVYATGAELLGEATQKHEDWETRLSTPWMTIPPLHTHWFDQSKQSRFDGVVLISQWAELGQARLDKMLARIAPMVNPGGNLIAVCNVLLADLDVDDAITFGDWAHIFDMRGTFGSRGFTPVGDVDPDVPLDTAVRFGPPSDGDNEFLAALAHGHTDSVNTAAIVCARWPVALSSGPIEKYVHLPEEEAELVRRLGRRRSLLASDRELVEGALRGLLEGKPPKGWERLAPELGAIAASGASTRHRFGLSDGVAPLVIRLAEEAMRKNLALAARAPRVPSSRQLADTRLCSGVDWQDRIWTETALAVFSPSAMRLAEQKRWIWERVSVLAALGLEEGVSKVLFVAEGPDALAHLLPHRGYDTTCVTLDELLDDADRAAEWRDVLATAWLPPRAPVRTWAERDEGARYDAVVTVARGLFAFAGDRADAALAEIHKRLRPGASLHGAFDVNLNDLERPGAVSFDDWMRLYDADGVLGGRGFTAIGAMDDSIPLDTVVRRAPRDLPQETIPGLSFSVGDTLVTAAVVSARWPEKLAVPSVHRPRRSGIPFDPQTVPLPYTDHPALAVTAAALDVSLMAVAQSASFDITDDAYAALAADRPARVEGGAVNILAYVGSSSEILRAPTSAVLRNPVAARLRFVFTTARAGNVEVEVATEANIASVVAIGPEGELSCTVQGAAVTMRDAPAGVRIAVALVFEQPEAMIKSVTVRVPTAREAAARTH